MYVKTKENVYYWIRFLTHDSEWDGRVFVGHIRLFSSIKYIINNNNTNDNYN